ncbi:hypothetical protein QAD02_017337 [Eretmocerus hayati]|uniref:Uncharacterized protein n=1 Tax=Eretmocerus hayati TaxID=131215 RepID=A0ACC2PDN2_9HYME|nr:hypothetical protein QAD02_017337 [Eretmocerus hayati]
MNVKTVMDFMELTGRLKHLKRRGWEMKNTHDPETISGHMYRMATLCFLVDPNSTKLDKLKLVEMALIHDLAECIVGDITPHCGISPEQKHKMEDDAMVKICENLGERGVEMLKLFREYEEQKSPEAQYIKDLDIIDLLMQAYEYEKRDKNPGHYQEFFTSQEGKIRNPFIKDILREIESQRKALNNKNDS